MPTINKFEDLEVWQLARKVEQFTFELTKAELLSKDFKLKNQMNDSSSSVMANIAVPPKAGWQRRTTGIC